MDVAVARVVADVDAHLQVLRTAGLVGENGRRFHQVSLVLGDVVSGQGQRENVYRLWDTLAGQPISVPIPKAQPNTGDDTAMPAL